MSTLLLLLICITSTIAVDVTITDQNINLVTLNISSRPVQVHLPPCLTTNFPTTTTPPLEISLLLSLHAFGSTAKSQMKMDDFNTLSSNDQQRGNLCAVLIYPQGLTHAWGAFGLTGFSWNAGGCCPNETTKKVDDVKFMQQVITAVTNYVTTTYDQTKPKHTFIVGVSNGGMLANRLTCELNFTSLRAFASISGPLVLKNDTRLAPIVCDRTKRGLSPVPLLHIHGLKDPIVPFGGCNSTYASFGKACIWLHAQNPDMAAFPDIPTYVNDWRVRNGQERNALQTVTFQNQTVTCTSSGNKLNNVTLCVAGLEGHSWPGANVGCSRLAPQLNCTNDIDASNAVWNFFESLI